MLRRIVITVVLAALPLAVSADSSALQINNGSSTSSNNSGNLLQPTSSNSLQASGNGQSTGLAAPSDSGLQQAPANSSAVSSYLNGEFVGNAQGVRPDATTSNSALWKNLLATVILLLILIGLLLVRRRGRRPNVVPDAELTEPVVPVTPKKAAKPKPKTKRHAKKTRKH